MTHRIKIHDSKLRRTWLVAGLVCLLGLAAALLATRQLAVQAAPSMAHPRQEVIEPPVTVRLDPALSRLDVGDRVTITIRTTDLDQLYGFQWKLRFNPAVLQVVDANPVESGVQIIPSQVFAGMTSIEASNLADNAVGEITHGLALFMEVHGVDGEAVLGQVVFQAVGEGVSALRFGTGAGQSRVSCLRDRPGGQTPVEIPSIWIGGGINLHVVSLPQVSK